MVSAPDPSRFPGVRSAATGASGPVRASYRGSIRGAPPDAVAVTLPIHRVSSDGDADWQIIGEIGRGGMGVILRARQAMLGREVALKMPIRERRDDCAMLLAEASVAAYLEHPAIIPVYAIAQTAAGIPFYAMRLVPGSPWSDSICRMDLDRDVGILITIAQAVAYAHSRGILHRDIKPSNVLVGPFGEAVLTDWGLASALRAGTPAQPIREHPVGSPAYFAPEVAAPHPRHPIGPASDVYLLGACLWEILTGCPPHPGDDLHQVFVAAAANTFAPLPWENGEPGPYAEMPQPARAALAAIAQRAMATFASDRHPDAESFIADLRAWQSARAGWSLLAQAEAALATARASGRHEDCLRAVVASEEAQRLLPLQGDAARLLGQARRTWAEAALRNGDLELARQQLAAIGEEGAADIAPRLKAELQAREQQRAASERLARVESRLAAESERHWRRIVEYQSDRATPADTETMFEVHGEFRHDADGLAVSGRTPHILAVRTPVRGDVRLAFSAMLTDEGDDLSCFLCGSDASALPLHKRAMLGYEFKMNWEGQTRATIFRARSPIWEGRPIAVRPDRPYLVEVERQGTRLRWRIDGDLIAEVDDPAPLGGGLAGVWCFHETFVVRRLRLEAAGGSRREDLVVAASRQLSLGHLDVARHLLDDVEPTLLDDPRRLAEAQAVREALQQAHAEQAAEALCRKTIAAWPTGSAELRRGSRGLALHARSLSQEVAALVVSAGLPQLRIGPEGATDADLRLLGGSRLQSLAIEDCPVADLAPLAGLPLDDLAMPGCRVRDLQPISGMPIRNLDLSQCPVADLAPLAGMQLASLDISGTTVRDLRPLGGMHGLQLVAKNLTLGSLAGLEATSLRSIDCRRCPVADLSPVAKPGPAMDSLHAQGTLVSDLGCLAGTEILDVRLCGSPIEDPSPLRECRVATLWLVGCRISDFSALSSLSLRNLRADRNPWRGGPLSVASSLTLRACLVEDGDTVADAASSTIDLSLNPLKRLGRLAERCDLRRLWFWSPELPDREIERCAELWRRRSLGHLAAIAEAYLAIRADDAHALRRALGARHGSGRRLRLPLSCTGREALAMATRLGARLIDADGAIDADPELLVSPVLTWP